MENICKVMRKNKKKIREREKKGIFERKEELCQTETSTLLKETRTRNSL